MVEDEKLDVQISSSFFVSAPPIVPVFLKITTDGGLLI
jgi:hypothetical protein